MFDPSSFIIKVNLKKKKTLHCTSQSLSIRKTIWRSTKVAKIKTKAGKIKLKAKEKKAERDKSLHVWFGNCFVEWQLLSQCHLPLSQNDTPSSIICPFKRTEQNGHLVNKGSKGKYGGDAKPMWSFTFKFHSLSSLKIQARISSRIQRCLLISRWPLSIREGFIQSS